MTETKQYQLLEDILQEDIIDRQVGVMSRDHSFLLT